MKRLALFLASAALPLCIWAQGDLQDVVYLKNGSIIRGIIMEQVPSQSLKIRTADGSLFVYNLSEVERITKEEPVRTGQGEQSAPFNLENVKSKGYTAMLEFGPGVTYVDYESGPVFAVHMINSYRFSRLFTAGLGLGLQGQDQSMFVPVFADLRFEPVKERVSPFVSLGTGYAVGLNPGIDEGGVYVNPSIGVRTFLRSGNAFMVSFGFLYQGSTREMYLYEPLSSYSSYRSIGESRAFVVRFGFMF